MYTSDHPTALPQARRWAHIIEAEANQDATPMVAAAQYTRAFAAIAQAEMLDGIAAAQIAQSRAAQRMAEAAERQAAAMERANEIALMSADPYGAITDKDAEIARLKDVLLAVRGDTGWGFLGSDGKALVRAALALPEEEEQRIEIERKRKCGEL